MGIVNMLYSAYMGDKQDIAKDAVREAASGEAIILDVRRDDEWNYLHAKGAQHFNIERLEAGKNPGLPRNKKLYTYCQAGGRAGRAATMLEQMGYQNVQNMGGLNDWRDAGGDVE